MARYANVSDLRRLGAIRTMPELKAIEPYPETAQPQNDIVIDISENRALYGIEMNKGGFYFREVQNAN